MLKTAAVGGGAPSLPHWKTRIYRIWSAMKQRCSNPNTVSYKHYGGRGIKVCNEWSSFFSFRDWAVSHGYADDLSIDRIDVDGDYCPENCRWSTRIQQANNKTNSRYIEYNGRQMTSRQWDRECGFRQGVVSDRLNTLGWNPERTLTEAVGTPHAVKLTYQGETHSISEWAAILGMTYYSLYRRLQKHHWSIPDAFAKPKHGTFNPISFNGKTFPLLQWARELGIPTDTLWKRIKCSHWPVEKALTTPVRHYVRTSSRKHQKNP